MVNILSRADSFLRSAVGRSLGPVLMTLGAVTPALETRISGVVVGGLVSTLSLIAVQRQIDELEKEAASTAEDDICEVLIHNIDLLEHLMKMEGGLFRACVYFVDGDGQKLTMGISSHGFTDADREVSWCRGEGPPGISWQVGRPVVAPPHSNPAPHSRGLHQALLRGRPPQAPANGARSVRALSATQVAFLEAIEMMICYPITDLHHPNRIVAVLALDDRLPPGPHLDHVLRAVEYLRDEVRRRIPASNQRNKVGL